MTPVPAAAIERRALLALLATVAASPASAALDVSDEHAVFRNVIRAVGGVVSLPQPLLNGCEVEFVRKFGADALTAMADVARQQRTVDMLDFDGAAPIVEQLHWIVSFLYTGEVDGRADYFPWCLGWQALPFTTAPGQCGGPFGYWVDA